MKYNIDEAYENFIKKILAVIDWFDVKIMKKNWEISFSKNSRNLTCI